MTVSVQSKGQTFTFRENTHGAKVGFSDTLWYGEDHFSLCHHIEGMRALVRYKPSSDNTNAGDFTEIQLRLEPAFLATSAPEQHASADKH